MVVAVVVPEVVADVVRVELKLVVLVVVPVVVRVDKWHWPKLPSRCDDVARFRRATVSAQRAPTLKPPSTVHVIAAVKAPRLYFVTMSRNPFCDDWQCSGFTSMKALAILTPQPSCAACADEHVDSMSRSGPSRLLHTCSEQKHSQECISYAST